MTAQTRIIQLENDQDINSLIPYYCLGIEKQNRPFHFNVRAISHASIIDVSKWLGANVKLTIDYEKKIQQWHGIITQLKQTKNRCSEHYFEYQLSLQHPLYLLKFSQHNRFYKNKNVIDIIQSIAAENHLKINMNKITQHHPSLKYCAQFNETDFDFFQRLALENKINYMTQADGNIECTHNSSQTIQHKAQDYSHLITQSTASYYKKTSFPADAEKNNATNPNQKQFIYGLQNARVSQNQTVYFPWAKSQLSQRLKHSHSWGNAQLSHQWLAQKDQESLISYNNGNCSNPLIAGKTYHSKNPTPFNLPSSAEQYGIQTSQNQFVKLNDKENKINLNSNHHIKLQASKNQHWSVKKNISVDVKRQSYKITLQDGQYSALSDEFSFIVGNNSLQINKNFIQLVATKINLITK